VRVGILEGSPALNELFGCIFDVLNVHEGAGVLLQEDHLIVCFLSEIGLEFGRGFVLSIAALVVEVALEVLLGFGLCLVGGVAVARRMRLPISEAQPAELVPAFPTSHVIAASIFFDGRFT